MRKYLALVCVCVLAMAMVLTSCAKSEFGVTDSSEKAMTYNAKNAAADDFVMSGTLEVAEGESISVESALESGSIKFELYSAEGNDDIDSIPEEPDGAAAVTAEATGTATESYPVAAGSYMVKATVTEKATGEVVIAVK